MRLLAAVLLIASTVASAGLKKKQPPPPPPAPASTSSATPELVVQSGHVAVSGTLSEDGAWLVTGGAQTAKIWDVGAAKVLRTYPAHATAITSVALSQDKRLLATTTAPDEISAGALSVFRTDSQERILKVDLPVTSPIFLPDGSGVVVTAGKVTKLLGMDGKERFACLGTGAAVLSGRSVLTVHGAKVLSCALKDGAPGSARTGADEPLRELAVSPDGRLVAATSFSALYLWTGEEKKPRRLTLKEEGAEGSLGSVAFSSPTSLVVHTGDALLHVDTATQAVRRVAIPKSDSAALIGFGARAVILREEREISIVDAARGELVRKVSGSVTAPTRFSLSRDGKWLLTSRGQLWDLTLGKATRTVRGGSDVAFIGDDSRYLLLEDEAAVVIELASGKEVRRFPGYTSALAVSRDRSAFALAHADRDLPVGEKVVVFDAATLERTGRPFEGALNHIDSLAFSSDGASLAVGTYGLMGFGIGVFTVPVVGGSFGRAQTTHTFATRSIAWSHDDDYVASAGFSSAPSVSRPYRQDRETQRRDQGHDGFVTSVAFHPHRPELLASGAMDGTVRVTHPETGALHFSIATGAAINGIAFSSEGDQLFAGTEDGSVHLIDVAQKRETAVLLGLATAGAKGGGDKGRETAEFVTVLPDGTYRCSRGALPSVAFRLGARVYPFEQFDLRLNRPHEVLKALGRADKGTVALYRAAWSRRVERMGAQDQKASAGLTPPEITFAEEPATRSEARALTLEVTAADRVGLEAVQLFVNDAPVFAGAGLAVAPKGAKRAQLSLPVTLSTGRNKLQLVALNSAGVESLRETREVDFTPAPGTIVPPPKTWLVSLGVSTYADARMNLQYAAKDATDVAAALAASKRGEVRTKVLTNAEVTREAVRALREWLRGSEVDDRVIVFVAGHGLLNANFDYLFAAHDIDFDRPGERGIPYEEIEGMLDGIPARHKLLLMDTCHSGELDDRERTVAKTTAQLPADKLVSMLPGARGFVRNLPPMVDDSNLSELLRELFADLRRGSGAVVIASAGGLQIANESSGLKNGYFTHALLAGVKDAAADANRDARLFATELRDFVFEKVVALSEGAQRPTTRREQVEFDFEWPR